MSGQMSENLTQQFANFVQQRSPQNAEAILTNTSSPEVAAQRESLAREFVKAQVEPKVDGAYQDARGTIGQGMPTVSGGGGAGTVEADYNQHSGSIDGMTHNAGIKGNVGQTVGSMVSQNKQAHEESRQGIQQQGDDVKTQQTGLENHHKKKEIILVSNIIKR
jgi:conjugal transfer mating pair stabilization protein TraG